MNQTRTFLILAWLMVATMLWMEWNKEQAAARAPSSSTTTLQTDGNDSVPQARRDGAIPSAPSTPARRAAAVAATGTPAVTVTTDVLRLVIDGGSVRRAELLQYPQTTAADSPPMVLFDSQPDTFYQAQSGWVSDAHAAPSHLDGFVPEIGTGSVQLQPGASEVAVPFVWTGPNGVSIRRTFILKRGQYALQVRDEVINTGNQPWQGHVYRQLVRVPPVVKSGFTHPESYSFHGAAWYSPEDKVEKRKFADYAEDGTLDKPVTAGWIGMLQHHFFSAWIPAANDRTTVSLAWPQNGRQALVRVIGPGLTVAPGTRQQTEARLWVGPKLVKQIEAQQVPGLERAVDFSSYGIMAALAGMLFWVLSWLHGLIGNWGWAIIGLVVIIKLLLFPLSAAQYKSAAKLRKFQPRVQQLKERYGEDKQKFQMALMELYRKEKINPMGGCLPILVQMPIFLALYWTLLEAVELRHAPWIGWIQNLTAPDPYFILPVINIALMWLTQRLTPMVGMDPMQQRIMQLMPLIFGVMMVFFPAGLVLYWVTNGALGLLQQWIMLKKYGGSHADPAKPA